MNTTYIYNKKAKGHKTEKSFGAEFSPLMLFTGYAKYYTTKYRVLWAIILTISLLPMCTEKMDIELSASAKRLAIEASFTTEAKAHMVKLLKSGDITKGEIFAPVSGAKVYITDKTDTFFLTETAVQKGIYFTMPHVAGKSGRNYHLFVENVDIDGDGTNERYTASEYMQFTVPIDSVKMSYDSIGRSKGYRINAWFKDPDTMGNNYLCDLYINNRLITDTLTELRILFDYMFNGKYVEQVAGYLNERKPDEIIKNDDKIALHIGNVSEKYWVYVNNMESQFRGQLPLFSGPAANVQGNIEPAGTAVGYFVVYPVTKFLIKPIIITE